MRLLFVLVCLIPSALADDRKDPFAEHKKTLQELVQNKRVLKLQIFIKEMADLEDPRGLDLIFPAVFLIPSRDTYYAARKALSEIYNEKALEHLISKVQPKRKSRKKGDFRYGLLVVDSFAIRNDERSLSVIIELLANKDSRLRRAAIRAAGERRRKETIPALIDLLERNGKRRGRTWLETREALTSLTAQNFDDIKDWRKFWDGARASLDPSRMERKEGEEKRTLVGKGPAKFYGHAITSHNLIFVIDTSSSMLKWDENEKYKGRNAERDLQRLWLAKKQLASTLKKLPKETMFNIIAYSDTVTRWKRGLRKATRGNVSSAIRFVGSFKAASDTHTDDALEAAFKDPDVDTIILLSDGAPFRKDSSHSLEVIEKILIWIDDVNPSRKIRIDTYGIASGGHWPALIPGYKGTPPPPPSELEIASFVDFLKQLSEKTGGMFQKLQ